MPPPSIGPAILCLAVLVLIFLICRQVVCWYWKINEAVALLRDIRQELKNLSPSKQGQTGTENKGPMG